MLESRRGGPERESDRRRGDVAAAPHIASLGGNPHDIDIASETLFFAVFALALSVMVGNDGLVSLGHAGLFTMAGYTAALLLVRGHGHLVADTAALAVTVLTAAVYAVLSLRAIGIGFLMITLAIGQILWGIADR